MKRLIIFSGRLVLTIVFCVVTLLGSAQNITRQYDNVSLSKALMELNDLQQTYTINFIYDELEDFRVTTSIKHKTVTEAIMQIVGFYPVRVVKRGESEIYVECTHKTERHLTGIIIDELSRVRQVINDINMRGTASVFYSITDSDDVAVHIKKHFLLVSQIPGLEDYLKLMLDSFFRTARTLDLEIEKFRLQECER